jgi:hypothetical protein
LPNEYQLLLICARKIWTAQQLQDASSAIDSGLDWDLLGRYAENHGLSPLLYWHLHRNFPLAVPARQDQQLRCAFENNVRRNLFLSASLVNVLEALCEAGTRVLAYKGPALATSLYGNVSLREMSDLDILIDHSSFPAAREVLSRLGYQPALMHTRKQEEARLRSDCEYEFSSSDGKVWIDLHWQITPPHLAQRFNFDDLWHRRRILTLGRKPIPTLSAEDTALVLAVHGGKHLWRRLSWLADFAESLSQNLDWQALKLRARDAHAERMLLVALALAKDIIQVPLPYEFADAIRDDHVVQIIADGITGKLFEDNHDAEQYISRWLAQLRLADSRWDGMRSAARFAFGSGPREWQAVRLPDSLFALYPLLRIAGLLRKAPSLFSQAVGASRGSG